MNRCSRTALLLTVFIYTVIGIAVYYGIYLSPTKPPVKVTEIPIQLSMFEAPQPPPPEPPPPPVEPPPPPPPVEPPPPPPPKPKIKPKPKKKKVVKKVKKKEVKKKPEIKPPPPKPVVVPPPTKPQPPKPVVPTYTPQQIVTAEQKYLGELRQVLAKHAQNTYPRRAKRRNWESEVTVSFVLLANGNISDLQIVVKAGKREIFNEAALDIFRKNLKMYFKAFPKEVKRDSWKIQLPISYTLR